MIKDYGICKLSIVPLRAAPSDQSEIVTQLMFGDYVKVLEKGEPWIKVYFPADDYEGWMDFKQLKYIEEAAYNLGVDSVMDVLTSGTLRIQGPLGIQHIMFGSDLPFINSRTLRLDDDHYTILDSIELYEKSFVETALSYLNTPYLWGGKGIFGIDCSGLTQMVAKIHGKKLPRDASQQVHVGKAIDFKEIQPGDLMYFINDKGRIHHVGIVVEEGKIIHASGHVRIDTYDEKGIFRTDFNRYTHSFHSIRRI